MGDVTVLVVSDLRRRPALLALLSDVDGCRVVGLAGSVAAALDDLGEHGPDVVLVDVAGVARLEDLAVLRESVSDPNVLLVSGLPREAALLAGLGAGARGYVERPFEPAVLHLALAAVAAGHGFVDPRCTRWLVGVAVHGMNARTGHSLSPRQAQVLRLAGEGLTNRQIGRIMGLSAETVKSHLREAMRRLGSHDRLRAAALFDAPTVAHAVDGEG